MRSAMRSWDKSKREDPKSTRHSSDLGLDMFHTSKTYGQHMLTYEEHKSILLQEFL